MQLDIIGDVHGHAEALEALLRVLGYRTAGGSYRHPEGRRAVFLGDLVDRGPEQVRAIAIVRAMIEAGTAEIVMGNHEFNAIAFATPDPDRPGAYLRSRSGSHRRNHAAFLSEVGGEDSALHRELVRFFAAMPLWLDLGEIGIVHACWSRRDMAALAPHLDAENRLTDGSLLAALTPGTAAHAPCEILVKGPEITLPAGVAYRDGQDSSRSTTRTRWWDPEATTIRSGAVDAVIADRLPDEPLPAHTRIALDADKLVFFGHYCMKGTPRLVSPRRACVDFCVAGGGVLCAYRFDGEPELDGAKLAWVG